MRYGDLAKRSSDDVDNDVDEKLDCDEEMKSPSEVDCVTYSLPKTIMF